jgi:hypothetical protein
MTYEFSPGDVLHIGTAVLTVLAVEGDQIRFKLESLEGAVLVVEEADFRRKLSWWELN